MTSDLDHIQEQVSRMYGLRILQLTQYVQSNKYLSDVILRSEMLQWNK